MRARLHICAAILVAAGLGGPAAGAAAAEPVAITQAPALEWGFKLSWRTYAGKPEVGGGATILPETSVAGYDVGWAFRSGGYDAETGTTVLRYEGSARWTGHNALEEGWTPPAGYDGPLDIDLLDLTLTDPVVTISRDEATIAAEARSRSIATWRIVDYGRIPVVDLGADAATPVVSGGTTTWAGIPATIDAAATATFGDSYYQAGIPVDPVAFSYTGPGGAPDYSDALDPAGSIKLGVDGDNVLVAPSTTPNGAYRTLAVDQARQLAYYAVESTVDGVLSNTIRAFDLRAMRNVGEPLTLPASDVRAALLNDVTSGRIYTSADSSAYPQRWIRFDREAGRFVRGEDPEPIPTFQDNSALAWDPVGERAFEVVRTVPDGVAEDDYDRHRWQLRTYARRDDGTWSLQAYDLPGGPAGLNFSRYRRLGAAASDGSLIVLGDRQVSSSPDVPAPAAVPGAYRVITRADGTAAVAPIAGADVPNETLSLFTQVAPGADGIVGLVNRARQVAVQRVDVTPPDGQPIVAEPVVRDVFSASGQLQGNPETQMTVDPGDGTVWLGGLSTQQIVGVRDGRIVADQTLPLRHTRAGALIAGPGHALVMQSSDGANPDPLTSAFGFHRLARLGVTPTITAGPADRSVSLQAGEEAEDASFSAAATADPAATAQWQVKGRGALRFANIEGATGATLTVAAKRGMDGTAYRAVFSNAAGKVATEPATLAVSYAPRIVAEPVDVTATEGRGATFLLLGDGNPEPEVSWQRRVAGFWQAIAADDDSFAVAGGALTVKETNVEQSGALFRAKLSNAAGAVHSRAAKLTVQRAGTIPPGGLDLASVSLDWTGNGEIQKAPPFGGGNYLSAGASDGREPTYGAAAGNVRVFQASASGTESPATWATRNAHVAGGGRQLVRLYGGRARIEPDGSATVRWAGAFTVNFYDGLVPFTFTDPELVVAADGTGTLRADLSGYASSQSNPNQRDPIPPVADVTVATFSGVRIDPAGRVAIAPAYAGMEVSVPAGTTPQNRTVGGWGAWPQPFVDFHVRTGLSSYWYSSGGAADAYKPPHPLVVDFSGAQAPPPDPGPQPQPPAEPEPQPQPGPHVQPKPSPRPVRPATIAVRRRALRVTRRRLVTVATLICPQGGAACTVSAPKRARIRIAGRRHTLSVLAPRRIAPGRRAALRLRLSRAAAVRLRGRRARVRLRIAIGTQGTRTVRTVAVTLRGARSRRPSA